MKRAVYVQLPPARRVLDFGCGTGWVLAEAETEGNPLRFGIDYSLAALRGDWGSPQLDKGRANPVIRFVVGDGLRLPFADGAFDVVIGHVSTPYMNTAKALGEIYRVLAPGGSLWLTYHNFYCAGERLWRSLRAGRWKDVVFTGYALINGLLNHFSLPQTQAWWRRSLFETVNTPRGVARSAAKQGFILISTEHTRRRIFFVATARKPGGEGEAVLPAPAWAVYRPLAKKPAM